MPETLGTPHWHPVGGVIASGTSIIPKTSHWRDPPCGCAPIVRFRCSYLLCANRVRPDLCAVASYPCEHHSSFLDSLDLARSRRFGVPVCNTYCRERESWGTGKALTLTCTPLSAHGGMRGIDPLASLRDRSPVVECLSPPPTTVAVGRCSVSHSYRHVPHAGYEVIRWRHVVSCQSSRTFALHVSRPCAPVLTSRTYHRC